MYKSSGKTVKQRTSQAELERPGEDEPFSAWLLRSGYAAYWIWRLEQLSTSVAFTRVENAREA